MKRQFVLRACLLLLWTLTAPVICNKDIKISVAEVATGVKLSCSDAYQLESEKGEIVKFLDYKDENTGEYTCKPAGESTDGNGPKIYVKFRTCDNCIELDGTSLTGMVVGNVVATIVIGVAVYLVASQNRSSSVPSHKKSSDRQHLVPREASRGPSELYQPLKGRQKETYDVLNKR